ncbi:rRNA maturation RNAse YbeY [Acetobacteraceae bacterium]|nr:rRNA maturation RNAse YbeY [Candidatus Parcubacteria bacterium]
MGSFSIRNKTRVTLRDLLFKKIKERVLGKPYELSLAVVSLSESRRLTKITKHADHASNVLSFPLSKKSGEIVLCPKARGEYTLEYLFIHGALHLKGLKHNARMDAAEERLLKHFRLQKRNK